MPLSIKIVHLIDKKTKRLYNDNILLVIGALMEKKHTIVHFLAAAALVAFAVALFNIASGVATTDRFPNPDGSYDYGPVLAIFIPFDLCIIAFAGLITVLHGGEFGAWLGSVGAIVVISLIAYFLNMMSIAAVLIGGVYSIWWGISAVRNLAEHWDSFYWENKLLAVCRVLIAIALVLSVCVWFVLPVEFDVVQDMSQAMPICGWAGGFAIAAAVALAIEGLLWIKYADY